MAEALVGGSFLSAFLQVLFDRVASPEIVDFFKHRKLNEKLLEKLSTTVISVNGVLDDAEEMQITRPAVKSWLDRLKDAIFEADDLLDEIAYEAMRLELGVGSQTIIDQVKNFFPSFNSFERGMETRLEEILNRLEYFVRQKNALGLREGLGDKPSSQKMPTTSLVDESCVYGRDNDKLTLMKLLLLDDASGNDLDVIPIVGMGGIGKTTLAQLVYNDSRVQNWFDLKAWVCVSEDFDVFKVTKDILKEVASMACETQTPNQLQLELKERLKGKKFLLVLDDVWNDKYADWDILRRPFKSGARGSKIIVTTRNESVASTMCTVPIHHLKELTDDDCWFLFANHAFDDGHSDMHPCLTMIGREIVRKCKGLPLAAKTIGGLMHFKRDIAEWEKISKSSMWDLPNDDILPALRLSYHYLPSHLKRCFAYCAIFPKDYEFEKEELVLLWMAEGFLVQPKDNKEMEEIGDEYFHDLVSRSLFQRSSVYHSCYTMHDLINDLAKSVSGEFCFRLEGDDPQKITKRTRHLSYARTEDDASKKFESIYEAQLLRTFLLVEWSCIDDEVMHDLLSMLRRLRVLSLSQYHSVAELPSSIGSLKHLRYLNLSAMSIEKLPEIVSTLYNLQTLILHECRGLAALPDSIGNLEHLRYLNLHGTSIKRLPESISNLYNLQTLILHECKDLIELPANMKRLVNLRHLDILGTELQEMPPQIGKLENLHILTNFILGKHTGSRIKELGELQNLQGILQIWNLQNVVDAQEVLDADLKSKKHLRGLELVWDGDTDSSLHERDVLEQLKPHTNVEYLSIVGYGGTRFPNWVGNSSFSNVITLELSGCKYCSYLPPLGQLASLEDLSIIAFDGVMVVGPEFYGNCAHMKKPFKSLKILRIERMTQWHEWISYANEDEAFPLLQKLHIRECPNLAKALPSHLPSLTTLEIEGCQQLVASLPRVPTVLVMKLKDSSRDVLFFKLPSGMHRLIIDRFYHLNHLFEEMKQLSGLSATLEEIEIRNCDSLEHFPLELFPKLKTLRLSRCPNLKLICTEATHGDFTSLSSLEIRKCPNLEFFTKGGLSPLNLKRLLLLDCSDVELFPEETLLPQTLISLRIYDFQNLKSMDYMRLQHLTALRELEISYCPKLQSMPKEGLPSSLSSLSICLCPLLEERCEPEKGEDWPKISHIPHIQISFNKIN